MSRKLRRAIWDLFFTSIKNIRCAMCKLKERVGPIKKQINDDGSRTKSTTNGEYTINHADGPIHIEIAVIDIDGSIHNEAAIHWVKRPSDVEDIYIKSDVDENANRDDSEAETQPPAHKTSTQNYDIDIKTKGKEIVITEEAHRVVDFHKSILDKALTKEMVFTTPDAKGATNDGETLRYMKGSTNDGETSRYIKGPTNDENRRQIKESINDEHDENANSDGKIPIYDEDAACHGIRSANDEGAISQGVGSIKEEDAQMANIIQIVTK
ncbi:unnamed protein product [Mytilus edulis]|uniref:Uncharacterized protein n=1 Tax=Mytilus edulis TaxID=6550 RepID=A0A8S3RQ29_MYTED|nr:unnamed protein product [Mytilus edulis]